VVQAENQAQVAVQVHQEAVVQAENQVLQVQVAHLANQVVQDHLVQVALDLIQFMMLLKVESYYQMELQTQLQHLLT
jgi:hypothetical protein